MKKKTITFVVGLLMFVSLISVGFASWIISVSTEKYVEGTITADTVVDATLGIKVEWGTYDEESEVFTADSDQDNPESNKIHFGAPKEMTSLNPWLTNTEADTEKLVVYARVTITNLVGEGYALSSDGVTIAVTAPDSVNVNDVNAVYQAAVDGKFIQDCTYIKSLKWKDDTKTVLVDDATTPNEYTVTINKGTDGKITSSNVEIIVKFEWKWGEMFGNINPYEYYNSNEYEEELTIGEETKTYLEWAQLHLAEVAKLQNVAFKATFTGKCSAN